MPALPRALSAALLGLGAAYITATRVSSREEGDHTVRLVAYAALLIAGFALAHQITEQDRVFGFYRPHAASPPILSPLLNPNHLAALTGAGAIRRMAGGAAGAASALVINRLRFMGLRSLQVITSNPASDRQHPTPCAIPLPRTSWAMVPTCASSRN